MAHMPTTDQPDAEHYARVFDIRRYGAESRANFDSRPAIQAAINAAAATGGGIVHIPAGTYYVSRFSTQAYSLTCDSDNVTIQGVRGESWLKHPTGMPASSVSILRVRGGHIAIRDLGFDGNWGNSVDGTDSQAGINHATQADPKNYGVFIERTANHVLVENCTFTDLYGDAVWIGGTQAGGATYTTVRNCKIDLTARNGITITVRAEHVRIHGCHISNTFTTAIDMEPQGDFAWVHDVQIDGCTLGVWWAQTTEFNNALAIDGAGLLSGGPSNWIRYVRVSNNRIDGNIIVNSGVDVRIDGNTIHCDYDNGYPPIVAGFYADDLWITNNRLFNRAFTDGQYVGAISLVNYAYAASKDLRPGAVHIIGNVIHARNGCHGIYIESTGGNAGTSGTATGITAGTPENTATSEIEFVAATVTHAGAGWTTDVYSGQIIEMGGALAVITGNTTDTLTLSAAKWTDHNGTAVSDPVAGAYVIHPTGGVVDVFDNKIDCAQRDGLTNGGKGIYVVANRQGMRVRIDRNEIRGAATHAIYVDPSGTYAFKCLEITRNHAWDDQATATCTTAIGFDAATNLGRLVLAGNTKGDEITTALAGLTSGKWLVSDGVPEIWAGYGAPTHTAPRGSMYLRRDGAASTTLYVNTDGGTTWSAK